MNSNNLVIIKKTKILFHYQEERISKNMINQIKNNKFKNY